MVKGHLQVSASVPMGKYPLISRLAGPQKQSGGFGEAKNRLHCLKSNPTFSSL